MKKILCAILILLPTISLAQPTVQIGGRDITGQFWPIKGNSDGTIDMRVTNPPYSNWNILGSGIQVTDIAGGATFKSSLAIAVQDFDKINLMVTFAVADTDTVAFDIFLIAKQSTQPADGVDMIIDMDDTDSLGVDGFFVCNAAGRAAYHSGRTSTRTYFVGKTNSSALTKGTGVGTSGTTTANVYIPVTTKAGVYIPIPILQIWVRNRKTAQLDDVTIDLWCKSGG